jgi:hypothetical protein
MEATLAFFARRWRGEVALRVLFWRDMLVVGTMVNVCVSFAALMMFAQGLDGRWAFVVHLAPLPYNAFLLVSVWRSGQRRIPIALAATGWMLAMTVV